MYHKGIAPLIIVLLIALGLAAGTTTGYAFREPLKKAITGKSTDDELTEKLNQAETEKSKFELEGIATSVDATNSILTVKVKSSTNSIEELRLSETPITVSNSATIQFGDQKDLKIADIPIDSQVHVGGTITSGKLTATKVLVQKENGTAEKQDNFQVGGTVKEVGTDKLVVTVKTANSGLKDEKGKDITIAVVIGTKIEKGNTVIALKDIQVGDEVQTEGYKADLYTANKIEVKVKEKAEVLQESSSNSNSNKNK